MIFPSALILFSALAATARAAAVPQFSTEVLAAFGLHENDLVDLPASLKSREVEAAGELFARVASCDPPTTPNDSTYGACVLPLNELARQGNAVYMLVLAEALTKKLGCPLDGIKGAQNRPVGRITAYRCTHPGPSGKLDGDAPGWSINTSFNPAACRPGEKCL